MSAQLGLGTYRCRDVTDAARTAVAAKAALIDTAPAYARGIAQIQLAPILARNPRIRVSTKAGHMTPARARNAHRAGLISAAEAARGHSINPAYLDDQIAINAAELGRPCLDLLYLHNPEHHGRGDRDVLREQLVQAFAACEQAAHQGRIAGYGVATWSGFTSGAFTVPDLLSAARSAAGGPDTHLRAIQLPVSLVQISPLAEALRGCGPIAEATAAGLRTWASAPLSGGELPGLLTNELAALIEPDLSPAEAALAVVASTPGLTGAVLSASSPAHWHQGRTAFKRPSIRPGHLREICRVLRA